MWTITVVMRKDIGMRCAYGNSMDILHGIRADLAEEHVPGWLATANVRETEDAVTMRVNLNLNSEVVNERRAAAIQDQVIELLSPRTIRHTISVSCTKWEPSA